MKGIIPKIKKYFPVSVQGWLVLAAAMGISSLTCFLLGSVTSSDTHVPLIFVLAVLVTALMTEGYLYGFIAAIISVFAVNWAFTYPYMKLDFTIYGYPLTFLTMLAAGFAIRHTRASSTDPSIATTGKFTAGELAIDYDKHQVLINGVNAKLTQNEFRIVALLGKCAGKVLTYDFIMKELWGPQSKGGNQILRVNMANIRRKIEKNPAEPKYIFTEVGVGYRMIEGD